MKILRILFWFIILCLYLAVLTKLVLFKYIPISQIIHHLDFTYNEYHWRSNNFVPFKTIYFYLFLTDINLNIRIENLAGNVIGFAPFGFILPMMAQRFQKLGKVIMATFCLSLSFEVLQMLFELGSFDVDDLILNTFGGMLGYILFKIKQPKAKRNKKRYKKTKLVS
ncbi:VanZ family protein [Neobacillus sedimentimangrovi]|jgi:glycopeptide antibiotics resistance protein|uniref:VanZ family protein n=1 Tax=Neobacillus sedimentimangrovi TaxID=2699460 RepID=A0ABS8QLL2_9BACI|nr:VanZ family protein [Neobacillus sedimentimangrovi]MCD4839159.1 VanZ family protein [Neobacillus sedimentimangrovi]